MTLGKIFTELIIQCNGVLHFKTSTLFLFIVYLLCYSTWGIQGNQNVILDDSFGEAKSSINNGKDISLELSSGPGGMLSDVEAELTNVKNLINSENRSERLPEQHNGIGEKEKKKREISPISEKVRRQAIPESKQHTSSNIVAGFGYSGDKQQMAPQACYNAYVKSTSDQEETMQLNEAVSFSELENQFGLHVKVSGKYEMFSADGEANYLRNFQDKDYSLSLNYYLTARNKVEIQLVDSGDDALTTSGKHIYKGGSNPYFGLECGDYYISSYEQGVLLTMGLNIIFSSSLAKQDFSEKAGASFADIISASESVKTIVTKNHITGTILIHAFQKGGDPGKLSDIINKDKTGTYHALECRLTDMEACEKVASDLLDYARNDLPKQFSFEKNTGLTSLGIAFSQYSSIVYIGLTAPESLVTQDVQRYRNLLSMKLLANKYYQEKLYPFFNRGYPDGLDVEFMNKANSLLNKATNNIEVLLQDHGGAADCFDFPDKCESVIASIDFQLHDITKSDLKFIDNIKYVLTNRCGLFYNLGSETSWAAKNDETKPCIIYKIDKVSVTDEEYFYKAVCAGKCFLRMTYTGKSTDGGRTYVGKFHDAICDEYNVSEKNSYRHFSLRYTLLMN